MGNEVYYYYLKGDENYDGELHPQGVVAIRFNDDGTVNRGISLCSIMDSFKKTTGRKLAYHRLQLAEEGQSTGRPLRRYYGNYANCPTQFVEKYFDSVDGRTFRNICQNLYWFHDIPTKFEYRMSHNPNDERTK